MGGDWRDWRPHPRLSHSRACPPTSRGVAISRTRHTRTSAETGMGPSCTVDVRVREPKTQAARAKLMAHGQGTIGPMRGATKGLAAHGLSIMRETGGEALAARSARHGLAVTCSPTFASWLCEAWLRRRSPWLASTSCLRRSVLTAAMMRWKVASALDLAAMASSSAATRPRGPTCAQPADDW